MILLEPALRYSENGYTKCGLYIHLGVAMGVEMKVSKWGNSLAIRIPARMAREMGLKEGDYVSQETLALRRKPSKLTQEEAMEGIREARKLFPKHLKPEDWKIDRNDPDMRG